jgi:hypothetical protein
VSHASGHLEIDDDHLRYVERHFVYGGEDLAVLVARVRALAAETTRMFGDDGLARLLGPMYADVSHDLFAAGHSVADRLHDLGRDLGRHAGDMATHDEAAAATFERFGRR